MLPFSMYPGAIDIAHRCAVWEVVYLQIVASTVYVRPYPTRILVILHSSHQHNTPTPAYTYFRLRNNYGLVCSIFLFLQGSLD